MPPIPEIDKSQRLTNLAPLVVNELVEEGRTLIQRGVLANIYDGLITRNGTFIIRLNERGQMTRIEDIREEREVAAKGKSKKVRVKVPIEVPYCGKHSNASDDAHLGADNTQYLLGCSEKNSKNEKERFQASAALHKRVLGKVDSPLARAICRHFDTWDPEEIQEHPALLQLDTEQQKAFFQSTYLLFGLDGGPHEMEDPNIREAFKKKFWDDIYNAPGTVYGTSYVSGEKDVPLADLFGSISRVVGAQSSGACPTSWGGKSDTSSVNFMGLRRGANYPTSKLEAILYIEALTYLMSDRRHYRMMPNGCYKVFWTDARDEGEVANTALGMMVFGSAPYIYNTPEDDAIAAAVGCVMNASPHADDYAELLQRSNVRYFTLNVKGNSARLQLTNFECGTFGVAMSSVMKHVRDTSLASCRKEDAGELKTFAFPSLLKALESRKNIKADGSYTPSLHQNIYDDIMNCILDDRGYPAFIGHRLVSLIAFDRYLPQERLALMRGYIQRNGAIPDVKEATSVPYLNVESDCQPYIMGRIFHTLLNIQNQASNFPKSTIVDRYFGQMLTHPEMVLPEVMTLATYHLRKLKNDSKKRELGMSLEWQLTSLMDRLQFPISPTMQLKPENQMAFCLGFKMAERFQFMPKEVKKAILNRKEELYHPAGLRQDVEDPAYIAGRVFFMCESLQNTAVPGVRCSIKEQYFSLAVTECERAIPLVLEKAQYHIGSLQRKSEKRGIGMWYQHRIHELTARLSAEDGKMSLPRRMTGNYSSKVSFILGYFHERAYRYRSKEFKKIDAEGAVVAEKETSDYGDEWNAGQDVVES